MTVSPLGVADEEGTAKEQEGGSCFSPLDCARGCCCSQGWASSSAAERRRDGSFWKLCLVWAFRAVGLS